MALMLGSTTTYASMASGTYTYASSTSTIWDISGDYSSDVGGVAVDFSMSQDSAGNFQGSGTFSDDTYDISGDISISGKVTGSGADPSVQMDLLMSGSGTIDSVDVDFTASAKIDLEMDAPDGEMVSRNGSVSVSVTDLDNGRKAHESERLTNQTFPLPSGSTGAWNLTLDLTPNGTQYTGAATLETSTGNTTDFTVTGTYSSKTDTSKLTLKGNGGDLSMEISTSDQSLTVKSVKGKVYGQSVSIK